MENTTPDLAVVRAEAAEAERSRIADISALCDKHGMADLGRQLIESGRSIDEARAAVLDKMNIPQEPVTMSAAEIGLSEKESRSFSFLRAINYLSNPTDRAAREAAAGPLYDAARTAGFDPAVATQLQPRIASLMQRVPDDLVAQARQLAQPVQPGSAAAHLRNRTAVPGA